jgi:hypothetical protein
VAISWLWAVKAIPWVDVLKQAPLVVSAADRLLSETRRRKTETHTANEVDALRSRIATLEARLEENAVVVKQLADQVERLTTVSRVLLGRLRIAYVLAAAGAALGFVSVVLTVALR